MANRRWSRDELLCVLHLYSRLPFGQLDQRNPQVIQLSATLGRTPGSVAIKLSNFAHLDPYLARRGMSNVSENDRALWAEYLAEPEGVALESEAAVARLGLATADDAPADRDLDEVEGLEREAITRVRVNQRFFRRLVLARYDSTCVVTGLDVPELLVAGHIVPWAEAPELRMNPTNGLCLDGLHDRAFEVGAITVDDDLCVRVADRVRAIDSAPVRDLLLRYDGVPLTLRGDIEPSRDFLRRHRERFAAA